MSARKRTKPHRLRKLYCRKKGNGSCQVSGIIRKQSGAGGDMLGSIGSHLAVASVFSLLKEKGGNR